MTYSKLYTEKLKSGRLDGKGGLSPETVTRIHNILHSALKQAPKEGLVVRNVAEAVSPPKIPRVVLLDFILQALKAHKTRQAQEKLFFGQKCHDNGLVFCTEEGKPIDPRNFTRRYTKLLKEAGLEHTRFHNLRHTFATLLLEMGEHPKVVQEMLGHSKISITLDTYSHIVPGLMEQAAAKLEALFGKKKTPSGKEGRR